MMTLPPQRVLLALALVPLLALTLAAQSPSDSVLTEASVTDSGEVALPSAALELDGPPPSDSLAEEVTTANSFARSQVKFFSVDHATLRYSEQEMMLEVFALVDRSLIGSEAMEEGFRAAYDITFQLLSLEDIVLFSDNWVSTSTVEDTVAAVVGKKVPEIARFLVAPGDYRIAVRVIDIVARKYYVVDYPVTVEDLGGEGLSASDMILASKIESDIAEGEAGPFEHNGLLVLPNADRMFGLSNPIVYYYTELYGLTEGGQYWVQRDVLDERREVVLDLGDRIRTAEAEDLVEMGALNIGTLRSGSFTLRLRVYDETSRDSLISARSFWVYRPELADRFVPLADPGFDVTALSDEEVAIELRQARYVMPSRIQGRLDEIEGPDAKRNFLAAFWAGMDPDKSTAINEAREAFKRRLKIVTERFGSLQKKGWTTDRGRVYLQHGEPSTIDYHPFDQAVGSAYEIWEYDQLEGGIEYVFVDRNNYGDYMLVHSTKRGEISNRNWYRDEMRGY